MYQMTHNMVTDQYNADTCEIQNNSWLLEYDVDPCEEDSNLDIATKHTMYIYVILKKI